MLTAATLGMIGYGLYAVVAGLADLLGPRTFELIIDLARMAFGLVLVVAAAFVRVMMPGGLALAMGTMLGLQALAIHNAAHAYGHVRLAPQVAQGAFAAGLVALAYSGSRRERRARGPASGSNTGE